jgi:hypothetical protein
LKSLFNVIGEQYIDNGGFHHANPCLIGYPFGKNGKNLKSINKFRLWWHWAKGRRTHQNVLAK